MKPLFGALAFAVGFTFAQHAAATPSLGVVLNGSPYDDPAYDTTLDTGSTLLQLTDVDGTNDDTNALIIAEFAGASGLNELYLYDRNNPANILLIFDGTDTVLDSTTLEYSAGTWTNLTTLNSIVADFTFGLMLSSPNGTFYSDPTLNADGFDHFAAFSTQGLGGLIGLFDSVVAIEDQFGGGDQDYNDMIVAFTDVVPFVIPTPAPLALFGLGLMGLGYVWNKKKAA